MVSYDSIEIAKLESKHPYELETCLLKLDCLVDDLEIKLSVSESKSNHIYAYNFQA